MMIKNLAPSVMERGKIKIGEKGNTITSKAGNKFQPPKKLSYFKVVTMQRGNDGNFLTDDAIHKVIGENPTSIPIRLLYDNLELNFQSRYSCFKGKNLMCSGDGEIGIETHKKKEVPCPCNRQDPAYTGANKCKMNGCLSTIIDGAETVGGSWKFRTTSYNSVVNILSSLTLIKSVTGGPLAGIPLNLTVSPKTVSSPTDGKVHTVYVVGLEYKGTFENLMQIGLDIAMERQTHLIKMDDLENGARKLLVYDNIVDEDVVEEFYPEEAVVGEEAATDTDDTGLEKDKPIHTAGESTKSIYGNNTYKETNEKTKAKDKEGEKEQHKEPAPESKVAPVKEPASTTDRDNTGKGGVATSADIKTYTGPWLPANWMQSRAGDGVKTGLAVFVKANKATFFEAPTRLQAAVTAKWKRVYPHKEWPITAEPAAEETAEGDKTNDTGTSVLQSYKDDVMKCTTSKEISVWMAKNGYNAEQNLPSDQNKELEDFVEAGLAKAKEREAKQ